jgi:hypothetical protein
MPALRDQLAWRDRHEIWYAVSRSITIVTQPQRRHGHDACAAVSSTERTFVSRRRAARTRQNAERRTEHRRRTQNRTPNLNTNREERTENRERL